MTLEDEAIELVKGSRNKTTPLRLIELHKTLIGGYPESWYCATCPGKLNMIFTDLKLKYYKPNTMANSKYTWNNEYKGVQIVHREIPAVVTEDNFGEHAAKLLEIKGNPFGHIISKNSTSESTEKSTTSTESKSTKSTK